MRSRSDKLRQLGPQLAFPFLVAIQVAVGTAMADEPIAIDWSWGRIAPQTRTARATTALGNGIVSVGGTAWELDGNGKKVKRWFSSATYLELPEMKWHALPDIPLPAGYGIAAATDGRVYVIGGRGENRGNAEMFVLNALTDKRWRPGPSLPRPRWGHGGGVLDGVIYVIGGCEGDLDPATSKFAQEVLSLDTNRITDGWKRIAVAPNTKSLWQMSTVSKEDLFLFGGLKAIADGAWLPQCDAFAYNFSARKWREIAALPVPLGSGACVPIDDRYLLIAGGVELAAAASDTHDAKPRVIVSNRCLMYDMRNDKYSNLSPMLCAVGDQGLVCKERTVFLLAGEDTTLGTRTDLVQIGRLR